MVVGVKTVLYLDDEEMLVNAMQRQVRKEPYRFLGTTSVEAALAMVSAEAPDLVITDFKMSPIDGLQFIEQARRLRPNAIYVVHSGFADDERIREAMQRKVLARFLAKPWDTTRIRADIREMLDLAAS